MRTIVTHHRTAIRAALIVALAIAVPANAITSIALGTPWVGIACGAVVLLLAAALVGVWVIVRDARDGVR